MVADIKLAFHQIPPATFTKLISGARKPCPRHSFQCLSSPPHYRPPRPTTSADQGHGQVPALLNQPFTFHRCVSAGFFPSLAPAAVCPDPAFSFWLLVCALRDFAEAHNGRPPLSGAGAALCNRRNSGHFIAPNCLQIFLIVEKCHPLIPFPSPHSISPPPPSPPHPQAACPTSHRTLPTSLPCSTCTLPARCSLAAWRRSLLPALQVPIKTRQPRQSNPSIPTTFTRIPTAFLLHSDQVAWLLDAANRHAARCGARNVT